MATTTTEWAAGRANTRLSKNTKKKELIQVTREKRFIFYFYKQALGNSEKKFKNLVVLSCVCVCPCPFFFTLSNWIVVHGAMWVKIRASSFRIIRRRQNNRGGRGYYRHALLLAFFQISAGQQQEKEIL